MAASKNDMKKHKKEIHENSVTEIKRELMLLSEKCERLFRTHEKYVNEKEEDKRDVHECDVCKFMAASKIDVEMHKKEIHETSVAESERLKEELMLFPEEYGRLFRTPEKCKEEAEEKVEEHSEEVKKERNKRDKSCLLYTSPSPRDGLLSRMPSSA